jgi:hypothetical protein
VTTVTVWWCVATHAATAVYVVTCLLHLLVFTLFRVERSVCVCYLLFPLLRRYLPDVGSVVTLLLPVLLIVHRWLRPVVVVALMPLRLFVTGAVPRCAVRWCVPVVVVCCCVDLPLTVVMIW